ncbi:recombination mediator Swi2 [Schizosaccharomyces osmophilus]|uniref:Recombination mediator Swi2 n=1 Tax=Schizosaccharomyces osmophilus TaxID=2545709 RepID=A0AAE9WC25_9SCHI|nr:recombination mediator Swi2 [Schizosaccharomyces osmophilus]WBW73612.1 recombination mediator Swi2 [Schizosaccharomyces osmophilus]
MRIHEFHRSEANAVKGENYKTRELGNDSNCSSLNSSCVQNSSMQPSSCKPLSDKFDEPLLTDIASEPTHETERHIRGFARDPTCSRERPNGDDDRAEACVQNESLAIHASHLKNQQGSFDVPEGHECMLSTDKIQKEKRKAGRPKKLRYIAEDSSSNGCTHKRKRGRPKGWRKNPERDVYLEMIDAPVEKRNPKSVFDAVVVPLNSFKGTTEEEVENEASGNELQSETNDESWSFDVDVGVKTDLNSHEYGLEEPVPGLTFESMSIGPPSSDLPSNNEPPNATQSEPDSETNFSFSDDDFAVLDKIEHEFEAHDIDQSKEFSSSDSISHRITLCEQNEPPPQKSATEIMELPKGTTLNSRKENNNIFKINTDGKANKIGRRLPTTSDGLSKLEAKSFGNPANFKYPTLLKSPKGSPKTSSMRTKTPFRSPFASKNSDNRAKKTLSKPFRPPLKKDAPFNIIDEEVKPKYISSSRTAHHGDIASTNDGRSPVISRLQSEISTLQDQISIVELANDLENDQEDEVGLLEKIQRWRRSAQLAVEVLFPVFSLKFTTMLQEVPESILPSVVDDLRSKPCNIGTFLEQLDIPFSLLNYNPDSDSWGDDA